MDAHLCKLNMEQIIVPAPTYTRMHSKAPQHLILMAKNSGIFRHCPKIPEFFDIKFTTAVVMEILPNSRELLRQRPFTFEPLLPVVVHHQNGDGITDSRCLRPIFEANL